MLIRWAECRSGRFVFEEDDGGDSAVAKLEVESVSGSCAERLEELTK